MLAPSDGVGDVGEVIPPDATIDSVRAGGTEKKPGIVFRWRWPVIDERGEVVCNSKGRVRRKGRYIKSLSYDDYKIFKRYFTKDQFYKWAENQRPKMK